MMADVYVYMRMNVRVRLLEEKGGNCGEANDKKREK
jgi:hypothetical protein